MNPLQLEASELNRLSRFCKNYQICGGEHDRRFGDVTLMCSSSDPTNVIMFKEKTNNNLADCERDIFQAKERIKLTHSNLLNMIDYSTRNESPKLFSVCGYYEYPPNDLEMDIKTRLKSKEYYTAEAILTVFENIAAALAYLQENKMVHGDIRPMYISVEKNGTSKLLDRLGDPSPPNQVQHNNFKKNKLLYMSPSLFKAFSTEQRKIRHNPYKSDSFSLGLVILEAGLLDSVQGIYDSSKKEVNYIILLDLLKRFMERYKSYPILNSAICYALEYDETSRLDPKKLYRKLLDQKKELTPKTSEESDPKHADMSKKTAFSEQASATQNATVAPHLAKPTTPDKVPLASGGKIEQDSPPALNRLSHEINSLNDQVEYRPNSIPLVKEELNEAAKSPKEPTLVSSFKTPEQPITADILKSKYVTVGNQYFPEEKVTLETQSHKKPEVKEESVTLPQSKGSPKTKTLSSQNSQTNNLPNERDPKLGKNVSNENGPKTNSTPSKQNVNFDVFPVVNSPKTAGKNQHFFKGDVQSNEKKELTNLQNLPSGEKKSPDKKQEIKKFDSSQKTQAQPSSPTGEKKKLSSPQNKANQTKQNAQAAFVPESVKESSNQIKFQNAEPQLGLSPFLVQFHKTQNEDGPNSDHPSLPTSTQVKISPEKVKGAGDFSEPSLQENKGDTTTQYAESVQPAVNYAKENPKTEAKLSEMNSTPTEKNSPPILRLNNGKETITSRGKSPNKEQVAIPPLEPLGQVPHTNPPIHTPMPYIPYTGIDDPSRIGTVKQGNEYETAAIQNPAIPVGSLNDDNTEDDPNLQSQAINYHEPQFNPLGDRGVFSSAANYSLNQFGQKMGFSEDASKHHLNEQPREGQMHPTHFENFDERFGLNYDDTQPSSFNNTKQPLNSEILLSTSPQKHQICDENVRYELPTSETPSTDSHYKPIVTASPTTLPPNPPVKSINDKLSKVSSEPRTAELLTENEHLKSKLPKENHQPDHNISNKKASVESQNSQSHHPKENTQKALKTSENRVYDDPQTHPHQNPQSKQLVEIQLVDDSKNQIDPRNYLSTYPSTAPQPTQNFPKTQPEVEHHIPRSKSPANVPAQVRIPEKNLVPAYQATSVIVDHPTVFHQTSEKPVISFSPHVNPSQHSTTSNPNSTTLVDHSTVIQQFPPAPQTATLPYKNISPVKSPLFEPSSMSSTQVPKLVEKDPVFSKPNGSPYIVDSKMPNFQVESNRALSPNVKVKPNPSSNVSTPLQQKPNKDTLETLQQYLKTNVNQQKQEPAKKLDPTNYYEGSSGKEAKSPLNLLIEKSISSNDRQYQNYQFTITKGNEQSKQSPILNLNLNQNQPRSPNVFESHLSREKPDLTINESALELRDYSYQIEPDDVIAEDIPQRIPAKTQHFHSFGNYNSIEREPSQLAPNYGFLNSPPSNNANEYKKAHKLDTLGQPFEQIYSQPMSITAMESPYDKLHSSEYHQSSPYSTAEKRSYGEDPVNNSMSLSKLKPQLSTTKINVLENVFPSNTKPHNFTSYQSEKSIPQKPLVTPTKLTYAPFEQSSNLRFEKKSPNEVYHIDDSPQVLTQPKEVYTINKMESNIDHLLYSRQPPQQSYPPNNYSCERKSSTGSISSTAGKTTFRVTNDPSAQTSFMAYQKADAYAQAPIYNTVKTQTCKSVDVAPNRRVLTVPSDNPISSNPQPVLVDCTFNRELYLPANVQNSGMNFSVKRITETCGSNSTQGIDRSKNFMEANEIPTFNYESYSDPANNSRRYVLSRNMHQTVIKPPSVEPYKDTESMIVTENIVVKDADLEKRYSQVELRVDNKGFKVYRVIDEGRSRPNSPHIEPRNYHDLATSSKTVTVIRDGKEVKEHFRVFKE